MGMGPPVIDLDVSKKDKTKKLKAIISSLLPEFSCWRGLRINIGKNNNKTLKKEIYCHLWICVELPDILCWRENVRIQATATATTTPVLKKREK